MHSKGFNGSWASKVVNHIRTKVVNFNEIQNQANPKTKLVLQETSTVHVEECPGISKFMKIRVFFICLTNLNLNSQTKDWQNTFR